MFVLSGKGKYYKVNKTQNAQEFNHHMGYLKDHNQKHQVSAANRQVVNQLNHNFLGLVTIVLAVQSEVLSFLLPISAPPIVSLALDTRSYTSSYVTRWRFLIGLFTAFPTVLVEGLLLYRCWHWAGKNVLCLRHI